MSEAETHAGAGRGSARAWTVWLAALVAYAVAVLHRTSFGVSGIEAADRFGVSATVLSTFVMVQLTVYATMQIPSGMLLDRFGSRAMIAGGAVLMAAGQGLLSVTHAIGGAYLARILIGAGDAATFIAVVRLVAMWFPARRVPLLTQLSGVTGQAGQVASALPLVAVLHARGWTTAFGGLAAIGLLAAALAFLAVRDSPSGHERPERSGGVLAPVRAAAKEPGTWLGFWSHALSQFPLNLFLLAWGYPFLLAEGLSSEAAGGVMTVAVVASVVSGPVIGELTARHPLRRSWIVLGTATTVAAVWLAVLVQAGPAPTWMLVLLAAVLGVGGPSSLVGFDFARSFNDPARLGTATGLVNGGGFAFAVVAILAAGVALDTHPGPELSLGAFRVAFAIQGVLWLVAAAGLLVARRRTRRLMASRGVVVPPVREVLARRRDGRATEVFSRSRRG
ncbi:MFS transporter [Isoptericola sp. b441]|uniref:MFS transporter n=1 Tax=Actinotalea lenta TaxID=3064654 RepID=A0ABT9DDE6_9CELL|nr:MULTISPECIES: MFS transporter [unclassified Isoptericola]MDO8107411.1 MFS transporter [Isoptericola sp. b441]MDO8120927.1 MFS transporter [Isoptericola sp. b490]